MPKPAKSSKAKLITHRDVAKLLGVSPTLVRNWVLKGVFPEPHSAIESTLFFPKAQIDYYVIHGRWPEMRQPFGANGESTVKHKEQSIQ